MRRRPPPVVARKLGIPTICEEDVVFVMMSPSGVTQLVHDAGDPSEGDSFRGTYLIPITKSKNKKRYITCIDEMFDPTFAPLIHLLKLQLK